MEAVEHHANDRKIDQEYRLSWVAYIRPVIVFLVLAGIGVAFGYTYMIVAAIFFGTATPLLIYQILMLRSVRLFTNADGVWFFQGILPWSKGTTGVKWRDIEDAVFFTGFVSWAFNSHTIRIGHRFTKANEIVLYHVRNGRGAVEHINSMHSLMIQDYRDNPQMA